MNAPHWLLILNGKSAGRADVRAAVKAMRGRGVRLDVRVTWEHGDAERMVDEAVVAGVDTLIAGGGDGTLGVVAGAMARRAEDADALPALGLLPLGTANDFARGAGIPDPPLDALELVRTTPAVGFDLLRVDGGNDVRWAANLATGGFGTRVTLETDERLKQHLGGFAYLLTGLSRLDRIEPVVARFAGDGFAWEGGFLALGIGNGRQAGGGQQLCPDALVDDGLLDVTLVPAMEGEIGPALRTLVAEGRAAIERALVCTRLPWVQIESATPMLLNLDGEPMESTRFRIDAVARRLRMHLPAGCALLS